MGYHVRAVAALYRVLRKPFARDWRRGACLGLGLLACLAQLQAPGLARPAPDHAAHAVVSKAGSDGAAGAPVASLAGDETSVPCPLHAAKASPGHGANSPAPCPNGDCPCCPCCAPLHAAIGILPQAMSRAGHAPAFAVIARPPMRLGSPSRFAVIAGQPRAPPILI